MAKKKSENEKTDYSLTEFMPLAGLTSRDQWVVEKILHKEEGTHTVEEWKDIFSTKCSGITTNYQI